MKLPALLSLIFLLAPVAGAQELPRIGAVLVVEDAQRGALVEEVGVAVYAPFLISAPYTALEVVQGREDSSPRVGAAIASLAERCDQVDVFLSTHTTERSPDELRRLIPPEARKLRLVYSTACLSASKEREAWLAVGARTVVTHVGINDPVWALPVFLSEWLRGTTVREAVEQGGRETLRAHAFLFSLPGSERIDRRIISGSLPALEGDGDLTIAHGWAPAEAIDSGLHVGVLSAFAPEALRYRRSTGGNLGLAIRALARSGFSATGYGVRTLLEEVQLTYPFDALDPGALRRVHARDISVPGEAPAYSGILMALMPWRPVPAPRRDAELVVELASAQRVPVYGKLALRFQPEVTVRALRLDPRRRVVELRVRGVDLVGYGLSLSLDRLRLLPDPRNGGYRLAVRGTLGGVLPTGGSYWIGGETPAMPRFSGPDGLAEVGRGGLLDRLGSVGR